MKKSFKKFVSKVAVGFLAACSLLTGTTSVSASEKVRIRFATWDSEESLDEQQALVDAFNESQDKIEVNLEAYGGDFDTIITSGMGAGDAPDVMYMWNFPLYHGGLEPLDPYIDAEGEGYRENFYEATWNYNSIDGTVYGMPIGFTTHVLYYNKDMFDEAGVEYPTDDWTWDDVRAASEKLSKPDENKYGLIFPVKPDPYDYEMYFWSNGGSIADDEGNIEGVLNSEQNVEVLTFFQNMLKDELATASDDSGVKSLEAGTAAMVVSGSWAQRQFDKAELNYGMVALPSFGDKTSVSVLNSSGLAMSKDSEHKEEAWEFIKYWTGEECNKARMNYELPVLLNVVEEEGLEEGDRAVFYTMLERSQDYTPSSFKVEGWNQLADDLGYVFESVYNPTTMLDPKESLDSAVK